MDKLICVGKNYLKHAREMGDAVSDDVMLFLKPPSAILEAHRGGILPLPRGFDVHHEVELVLKIDRRNNGEFFFSEYTIGLDLTLRDLQSRLKKAGQPWEKAKVFRNSAVLGEFHQIEDFEKLMRTPFSLKINGVLKQEGLPSDMRFKPEELLSDADKYFPVREGDLFFTGTPEGVGPLKPGDRLEIQGGQVNYTLTCGEANA